MFLSARDIEAMEGTRKVHFLNPDAIRINKSLGDAVGLKNLGVHLITVAPGNRSTEYHCHLYEEECIYILSGSATAVIGDTEYTVAPGDFIGCPLNGVAHELINTGSDPLECLVIGQRLLQDVGDYPRKQKRLYRNSGHWELVDYADIEQVER